MGGQWCGIPGVASGQQNASGMRDILHIMLHMSFCLQNIFLMALGDTLPYLLNLHLCLGKMSNVWPMLCWMACVLVTFCFLIFLLFVPTAGSGTLFQGFG